MDPIQTEVYRTSRSQKVMHSYAALRGKIPHAGICSRTCLRRVSRIQITYRGIFVIRPDHAARRLHPGHKPPTAREVPAHHDRGNAGARVGSTYGIGRTTCGTGRTGATDALKLWGVGLPQRKDLDGILDVAAQETSSKLWGEHFAQMPTDHEEAKVRALLKANASLHECTILPMHLPGLIDWSRRMKTDRRISSLTVGQPKRRHCQCENQSCRSCLHSSSQSKAAIEWRLSHLSVCFYCVTKPEPTLHPCRSSNIHSGCRRDLQLHPADASSRWLLLLRVWCMSRRPLSPRQPLLGCQRL